MATERVHLKPDSPEYWLWLDKEKTKLDADKVILWLKEVLNIPLLGFQESTLRNFITMKNSGKDLTFMYPRQMGITTVRDCMVIINALYNN